MEIPTRSHSNGLIPVVSTSIENNVCLFNSFISLALLFFLEFMYLTSFDREFNGIDLDFVLEIILALDLLCRQILLVIVIFG